LQVVAAAGFSIAVVLNDTIGDTTAQTAATIAMRFNFSVTTLQESVVIIVIYYSRCRTLSGIIAEKSGEIS
jgi:hypothetical protein